MLVVLQMGWYWGPLSWEEAEAKLEGLQDGTFLLRDSSDDRYLLSLSFRSQGSTHHTRIEHNRGMQLVVLSYLMFVKTLSIGN
jgi:hypothetical protein